MRCAAVLGKPQASGLINAVLRNFLRKRKALLAKAAVNDTGRYAYPHWWIDKVRAQYPRHYADILAAGNLHPPFTCASIAGASAATIISSCSRNRSWQRPRLALTA